jgi:hypothetical protein
LGSCAVTLFNYRLRHKYRVKPGSAALARSSLSLLCIFLLLSFALAANYLAAPSLPPAPKAMDRKPDDPDEVLARAKADGYRRGEHREQGAVPDRHAYTDKTIYDQDGALRHYMVYEGPSLLVYKWAPVLSQSSRWKLGEMREDAIRSGVTPPDKRAVREHCLAKESRCLIWPL